MNEHVLPAAVVKRYMRLAAACVFVWGLAGLIPDRMAAFITPRVVNTGYILAVELPSTQHATPIRQSDSSEGVKYQTQCEADPALLQIPAVFIQHAKRIFSPTSKAFYCRIRTNQKEIDWLKQESGKSSADFVRKLASGLSNGRHTVSTEFKLFGRWSAAVFVYSLLQVALVACAFAFLVSWRRDVGSMLAALRANFLIVAVLPVFVIAFRVFIRIGDYIDSLSILVASFVQTVLLAPAAEEVLYRLIAFELVKRYSNAIFAAVFASALFALHHGRPPLLTIELFLSGMILQYVYNEYRSLTLCIACHGVHNAFSVALKSL